MRLTFAALAAAALAAPAPVLAQSSGATVVLAPYVWSLGDLHESSARPFPANDMGPVPAGTAFGPASHSHLRLGLAGTSGPAAADTIGFALPTERIRLEPGNPVELAALAGYRVDASTTAFVSGGYASARVAAIGPVSSLPISEARDGLVLGAGIERLLQSHVSARLEYFYSDLGSDDLYYEQHRILAGIALSF